MVEHHNLGVLRLYFEFDFLDLARACKQRGIGGFARACDCADDLPAIGLDEQVQLLHRGFKVTFAKINADD